MSLKEKIAVMIHLKQKRICRGICRLLHAHIKMENITIYHTKAHSHFQLFARQQKILAGVSNISPSADIQHIWCYISLCWLSDLDFCSLAVSLSEVKQGILCNHWHGWRSVQVLKKTLWMNRSLHSKNSHLYWGNCLSRIEQYREYYLYLQILLVV